MEFRLLIVEQSEAQAQRIVQVLKEGGLALTWERAGSAVEVQARLERGADVVICAHALPGLSYTTVLALVQERGLDLPVIIVSPGADEDVITRALRLGARDFVSQGRLGRLAQAVRRELDREVRTIPEPRPDVLLDLMEEAYGLHEVIQDASGRPVDFRWLHINRAYERLTGLRAVDVVGHTAREMVPDLAEAWIQRFCQVGITGEPGAVEDYPSLRGRTFAGLAFSPAKGRFALLFNDVTETRALEASQGSLAAAVDQATEGIMTADLEGRISYANPALEALLAGGGPRLAGRMAGDVLPGIPPEAWTAGSAWQGRVSRSTPTGTQVLDCALAPVRDPGGRPKATVGIVRDVSLEAETERSLRQMEKMKALGEVAGGISHDFNNLLTAILSATELIEWNLADDSPIRHKLQVIYQAVMRARELNKQVLAFSRNQEEKFIPFDLSVVVKEAVHLIKSTFPPLVEVRASFESGIWINGNGAQIHQVVMNIAINALQAMLPKGGVLEIILEGTPAEARLTLRDTGCGMDAETLDRIFEPFFTTKERAAGKGLGLSVVHGIVTAHGGAVTARSEPGRGSTFTVAIPAALRPGGAVEEELEAAPTGTERVLFVDDEEVLAALGKQGLQLLGYRVTARSDAKEALEEIAHHPQDFDILVTDLSMPGLSGVELTQQVRKIRPDLPAILITGAFQDPLPLEGMSTPFAEVLLKPSTILEMARAIRKVMALVPARAPEPAAEAAPRPEGDTAILLAEDSHTTRSLLRSWLVKAGYKVDEARDGQEAWEHFERNPGRYSMVVTDIIMPRLDGLGLGRRIRAVDPSIPMVMLSSSESTESVKEALHLQVSEFLTKPFESRLLVSTVERLCADQATRLKNLRSHETAQAVRMAQRAMEALPERDMPIYSISEPLTDAGGDVFKAFRRDDGTIFFSLADVAGHSVISSYAVAAYLGMLANFMAGELDLRNLAFKLNRAIQAGPFSEVPICGLFGHWNPRTGRIHILNAGIPHALWQRGAQSGTRPVALNGAPLGILDEPIVEEKVLLLSPGDRLLLGSDGFFDALGPGRQPFTDLAAPIWENLRSTDIFQAINLVSEAARSHSGGTFGDDLLVVALEQPPLDPGPQDFILPLPSDAAAIDRACDALSVWIDGEGDPGSSGRYDTLLAVREALSNAVLHGNREDPGAFLGLWARRLPGGAIAVGVVDEGQGFDLEAHQPPDTDHSERGRGIPLIRHFARQVSMAGGELLMQFQ